MDYFFTGFHLLFYLATSYSDKFESKLKPSSNTWEIKIHQRKNTTTLRIKKGKIHYNEMSNNNRMNFSETSFGKKT